MGATVFYESSSELATLSNTFTVDGAATDPTTVTLTVTSPSGTATVYTYAASEITKSSTGVYTKDVVCSEAGDWSYLWEGTGSASDAVSGTWTVFETSLGKLYCTVEAVKSRLKITDTVDDYELHVACFAASRSVESVCERTFWRTPTGTVRTFAARDLWTVKLGTFNDLVTLSALATDAAGDGVYETTWASSDYQLLPVNPDAAPETRPYTQIKAVGTQTFPLSVAGIPARDDRVQVTGVFGWPAIPWGVKKAAQMLAEEMMKDAPYGVAGFGEFGVVRVRENPRIQALLQRYIHPAAAVLVG